MLTKRLPASEVTEAHPLLWRSANAPAMRPQAVPAGQPGSQPHKPQAREPDSTEVLLRLQRRVTELETSMEQRGREARDAGYREGEAAGRNQGTAQVQPLLDKLARSIQEIAEARPKLRAEAERDLLKLSLAIAQKVLHRELSTDPDAVAGLIKACLDKIRLQEIVRVRIHPQHHAPVHEVLAQLSHGAAIELMPDPKLQLGGVIIETSRGEYDSSVDVQLKEIERGLTDRLRRSS